MIALSKPIVFLDLETTGVNIATDRITEVAAILCDENLKEIKRFHSLVNPGKLIPKEVEDLTGITNDRVKDAPPFSEIASALYRFLDGHDIGGFGCINFDVPLLWEEFHRATIDWDLTDVSVIDAGNIFKKKEERTLSAAVRFYLGHDHEGAHSAMADTEATLGVFVEQAKRYQLASDSKELAQLSAFDRRVDLSGKIILNDSGTPVYGFGKVRGVPVAQDHGFAWWMLGKDFPAQTKAVIRRLIGIPKPNDKEAPF